MPMIWWRQPPLVDYGFAVAQVYGHWIPASAGMTAGAWVSLVEPVPPWHSRIMLHPAPASRPARSAYFSPPMLGMLAMGFSSGLPLLLVFSTLTFWLLDSGIDKAAIGLFALVKTPYTFKFLLAPVLDGVRPGALSRRLGHRRGWALLAQAGLVGALVLLSFSSPAQAPLFTAAMAVLVALFSATQDVALDAYRVERFPDPARQGMATAVFVTGYRLAMLVAGAGALWLASHAAWPLVYLVMATLQGVGVLAVLFSREGSAGHTLLTNRDVNLEGCAKSEKSMTGWLRRSVLAPIRDFMRRPGWVWFVGIALTYKLGDAFLGVMSNPFYVETGFTKIEIAEITKLYGFIATLAGAFFGGWLVARWGMYKTLLWGGVLQLGSNLTFLWLAAAGHSVPVLAVVVTLENLSGGIGTTAYLTFFAALCHRSYTATQFALLTSLMALARDLLAAQSGFVAEAVNWPMFFLVSSALALPGILLVFFLRSTLVTLNKDAHSPEGLTPPPT